MGIIRKKEDTKKFSEVFRSSMPWVFFAIILLFFALVIRLFYIVMEKGDAYSRTVLSSQAYSSKTIKADRGQILDRNGIVLAKSRKIYNVVIDPAQINTNQYYYKASIEAIVKYLGYDEQEIKELVDNNKEAKHIVYERDIDYSIVSEYNAFRAKEKFVTGVDFEEEYIRVYPYGSLASHVIGFTNSDGTGNNGLELYYQDELSGTDGLVTGYYDAELNNTKVQKDAVNGNTLVTTIDYNVQTVIERQIREFLSETECENIGIIVMDPNTGEILGMASNQEYDLNNPRDIEAYFPEGYLDELTPEQIGEVRQKLWRNFCVSDSYEPGSTFKTVTVAAALEEGAIKTNSEFYCSGSKKVDIWPIGCGKKSGHGHVSTAQALMSSCNVALMDMAEKLGVEKFYKYQLMMGFGRKTGIDLPGESKGIITAKKNFHEVELATSSFGTTFNASPIQLASVYCSLVNGGTYYKPHVVKEIMTAEGSVVEKYENMVVRQTISASTSEFIRQALYATVTNGTAPKAAVSGYLIGAKTGTAQKRPRSEGKHVVSLASFAPVDNPQVVMYVVMDEIHDSTKDNSATPAEVTSKIYKEILPYLGLYPDGKIEYVIDESLLGEIGPKFDESDESNMDVIPVDYVDPDSSEE